MDNVQAAADQAHPFLEVTGPGGESFSVDVPEGSRKTIGRSADNDIVLGNDPHVSRLHCTVLCRDTGLEVSDSGSKNGTLVHLEGEWRWVRDATVLLGSGDTIRISGRPGQSGQAAEARSSPGFWDLTFHDPLATQPVDWADLIRLEFAWSRNKVFLVEGARRKEVALNPASQEHKLLRYMEQRNAENHNVPIDCTHDELIAAIWADDQAHGHTANDIAHLVRDLRMRLEPKPDNPRFIITVRGGYRLVTHPLPEWNAPKVPAG